MLDNKEYDLLLEYCQIYKAQSQNLNVSHLVLQVSLPNPLKPGVGPRMKM